MSTPNIKVASENSFYMGEYFISLKDVDIYDDAFDIIVFIISSILVDSNGDNLTSMAQANPIERVKDLIDKTDLYFDAEYITELNRVEGKFIQPLIDSFVNRSKGYKFIISSTTTKGVLCMYLYLIMANIMMDSISKKAHTIIDGNDPMVNLKYIISKSRILMKQELVETMPDSMKHHVYKLNRNNTVTRYRG